MQIPRYFCWTRFGTEAAQTITQILERKEEERQQASGIFLWGIGSAVGQSILTLLGLSEAPEVLFSEIKSPPRPADVHPPAVAAWTDARGLCGEPFDLPEQALVTSRFDPASPKRTHYALVCHSEQPLVLSCSGVRLQFRALRNLATQRPVGASQVTAVVEYLGEQSSGSPQYTVSMRAHLVPPYFIRLHRPIPVCRVTRDGAKNLDFEAARAALACERSRARQLVLA